MMSFQWSSLSWPRCGPMLSQGLVEDMLSRLSDVFKKRCSFLSSTRRPAVHVYDPQWSVATLGEPYVRGRRPWEWEGRGPPKYIRKRPFRVAEVGQLLWRDWWFFGALMPFQLLPSRASALPASFRPSLCPSPLHIGRRPVHWDVRPPHPWRRRRRVAVVSFAGEDVDAFTKFSGYLFEGGASEADLLEEYDLEAIAAIYRRKPLLVLRRFVQIGTTFGSWFAVRYLDSLMERSEEMFKVSGLLWWLWSICPGH